jgi:hypothetical protein
MPRLTASLADSQIYGIQEISVAYQKQASVRTDYKPTGNTHGLPGPRKSSRTAQEAVSWHTAQQARRPWPEVGPWDAISDCYALNVDDTSTWACYDSDFPVVRIRDDAVTGWHNDIKGASALAVAGSRVALFGGYGPDHDRLAVTELDDERARLGGQYRIVLPDREPLAPGTQVIGRGSRLHFLTGGGWYQLDVGDIPQ